MYLVAGGVGVDGKKVFTTEVMTAAGSSWSYVGNLPRAIRVIRGITLNNQIFVTGNKNMKHK